MSRRPSRQPATSRTRPRTLGDLIAAVHDRADRVARGTRERQRLAALWVAMALLRSGNETALRRLATAV